MASVRLIGFVALLALVAACSDGHVPPPSGGAGSGGTGGTGGIPGTGGTGGVSGAGGFGGMAVPVG